MTKTGDGERSKGTAKTKKRETASKDESGAVSQSSGFSPRPFVPKSASSIVIRVTFLPQDPPEAVDTIFIGHRVGGAVVRHRIFSFDTIQTIPPVPGDPAGLWRVRRSGRTDSAWRNGDFPPAALSSGYEVPLIQSVQSYLASVTTLSVGATTEIAERELQLWADDGGGAGDPGPHFHVISHVQNGAVIAALDVPIVLTTPRSPV